MAEAKATLETVRAAVVHLLLNQKDTSTKNVCEITGGSNTTIGPLIEKVLDELVAQRLSEIAMSRDFMKAWAMEIGRHLTVAKATFEDALKPNRMLAEEARQQLAEKEKELEELLGALKAKEKEISGLTHQIGEMLMKHSLLEAQVKRYEEERQIAAVRHEDMVKEATIRQQELTVLEKKSVEDAGEICNLRSANEALSAQLHELDTKVAILEQRVVGFQETVGMLEKAKANAEVNAGRWLDELHALQKENGGLRERAATAESKVSKSVATSKNAPGHAN